MGGCPDRARRSAVCGLITMGFLCAFRGSAGLESGVPRALYFPMSTVHCPPSTFHHPLSTLTLLTILTGLTGCLQSFPRRPMSVGWRMRWPWSGRRVFYGLAMRNLRASFKCDRLSVDTLRPYTYSPTLTRSSSQVQRRARSTRSSSRSRLRSSTATMPTDFS